MDKIKNGVSSPTLNQIANKEASAKTSATKKTTKPPEISSKESLKLATKKARTDKEPVSTKTDKGIKATISAGLDYLKGIRDQAREDRKKGIGTIQGANDFWTKVNTQAEKLLQKAQDKVLDDLANTASEAVSESIKGTKLGEYLDEVLEAGSSKASKGVAQEVSAASKVAGGAAGTLGKVVGGLGAAYSLYQLYDTFGKSSPVEGALNGATVGAYAGTFFGPGGMLIGGALGGLVGAGLGLINNRRHPEHIQRDQMRESLAEYGFIDRGYNIKLADGSNYSLAIDGKKTIANQDGTKRYGYQIDSSNPQTGKAIALLQPLAEVLTNGHDKLKTDLIGYLVNAATSNASSDKEIEANILAIYDQSKLSAEDLASNLLELNKEQAIDDEEIKVYANDLSSLLFQDDSQIVSETELLAA